MSITMLGGGTNVRRDRIELQYSSGLIVIPLASCCESKYTLPLLNVFTHNGASHIIHGGTNLEGVAQGTTFTYVMQKETTVDGRDIIIHGIVLIEPLLGGSIPLRGGAYPVSGLGQVFHLFGGFDAQGLIVSEANILGFNPATLNIVDSNTSDPIAIAAHAFDQIHEYIVGGLDEKRAPRDTVYRVQGLDTSNVYLEEVYRLPEPRWGAAVLTVNDPDVGLGPSILLGGSNLSWPNMVRVSPIAILDDRAELLGGGLSRPAVLYPCGIQLPQYTVVEVVKREVIPIGGTPYSYYKAKYYYAVSGYTSNWAPLLALVEVEVEWDFDNNLVRVTNVQEMDSVVLDISGMSQLVPTLFLSSDTGDALSMVPCNFTLSDAWVFFSGDRLYLALAYTGYVRKNFRGIPLQFNFKNIEPHITTVALGSYGSSVKKIYDPIIGDTITSYFSFLELDIVQEFDSTAGTSDPIPAYISRILRYYEPKPSYGDGQEELGHIILNYTSLPNGLEKYICLNSPDCKIRAVKMNRRPAIVIDYLRID